MSNGRRLSIKEVHAYFEEAVSKRSIHRDILANQEAGIPLEYEKNEHNERIWFFPSHYKNMISPVVHGNELLSLYILKSYLKIFANTFIDKEINSLQAKIEELVPGELYMEFATISRQKEGLFWDQSFGDYDYNKSSSILTDITRLMVKKNGFR